MTDETLIKFLGVLIPAGVVVIVALPILGFLFRWGKRIGDTITETATREPRSPHPLHENWGIVEIKGRNWSDGRGSQYEAQSGGECVEVLDD